MGRCGEEAREVEVEIVVGVVAMVVLQVELEGGGLVGVVGEAMSRARGVIIWS